MATSVIPQSRSEQILAATINGEEYNQPPQSRIERLLLELKAVVDAGGGSIGNIGTPERIIEDKWDGIGDTTYTFDKDIDKCLLVLTYTRETTLSDTQYALTLASGSYEVELDTGAIHGSTTYERVVYLLVSGIKVGDTLYMHNYGDLRTADIMEISQGGGTTVVANPSGEATDDLVKIKIGSTIYSIEGGAPGMSFDKIWENPAPEDSINASDITIPSVAAYEKFLLIYKLHKQEQYPKYSSVIFKKGFPGTGFMISVSSNKINLGLRDFDITNDTTFHVGTCRVAQGSLDAVMNSAYCIPYILYGINETAGGGSGVSLNYNQLINRPVINMHTLEGNKTGSDYDLVDATDGFTAAQKAALLALIN